MGHLFLLPAFAMAMWLTWRAVRPDPKPRPYTGRTWLGVLVDALEDDR